MDILNNIWLALTVLTGVVLIVRHLHVKGMVEIEDAAVTPLGVTLLLWAIYTPIYLIIRIWS